MNNILTLRGNRFTQEGRKNPIIHIKLPKNSEIRLSHLKYLHSSLVRTREFWHSNKVIDGILISVYYDRIVAKSNRISGYLDGGRNFTPVDTVVGAKFNSEKTKHIITHYITRNILDKTINISNQIIELFEKLFSDGIMNDEIFNNSSVFDSVQYDDYPFSKSTFKQYLRDSYFVENFGIEEAEKQNMRNSIVTFYDVKVDIHSLLKKINIDISAANILDQTTVLLDEKNVEIVLSKVPYLVSMAVENFSSLSPEDFRSMTEQVETLIPAPKNEPIIGVIDTLFDNNVYFSKWVEYYDLISDDIRKEVTDYTHGTAVSSLIVDAPNLNKNLDDGCGRFRVRHFGVALHRGFNSFNIIKQIREIVSQNTDIKVWNLSLGSNDEIKDNFISAEAAVLDEIQSENDVIFVIAGTNGKMNGAQRKKIGSPADSLNSLIVNSVDFEGNPTSYSRKGIVLSFFIKPDVAYYGGGNGQFINVCEPLGAAKVTGTSYAAPLVARKLAYLIHIMGLRREEAKALLIDSAINWNNKKSFEEMILVGNGIIPIKIDEILAIPDDEIKFIVSDISERYNSYNYNFPVPVSENKHPYVAKATMCYFPKCSRNQGVDYTNTELNITFGRLTEKGIKPINDDRQHFDDAPGYIKEYSARAIFRKWDNVKHICESFTQKKKAKSVLNMANPQWGMSVKTVERLRKRDGEGIRFGVVVTLKEINGVNRIDDFIKQALLRGWLVNELRIEAKVDIYNKLNEEIEFS
ncbi:S8 family peptidase [Pasteurella multocida]|uniref:S8 family peptidase n=1 Tax=Pasteurella multocida TaxID=747 RepID=UPI0008FA4B57|nr:S8 family peptidase [Pasteurella multocida]MDC4234127.1 S8 family peptidase [Pasteurella multocida]OIQ15186.1 serine protease [Pasteurella multocida subsp. multocida]PNW24042.1 serine protease [Pasteurella multocida subsp. multocida]